MERRSIARVMAAASALALGLAGCQQTAPATDTGEGEFTPDTGAIESVESVELADFKTIYFDYDQSAIRAVKGASPFPKPPDRLAWEAYNEGFLIEFDPSLKARY